MIFNTVAYYLVFLIPAAIVFRSTSGPTRAWSSAAFGAAFFTYYSATQFGGRWGVACVFLFVWEGTFRSFYRPGARACLAGVAVSVGILVAFKYWNFLTGLAFANDNPVRWEGAFLPLGVSFFTFEFIHYAVDRYRGKVERGTAGEYLAFLFFFPTMVAGPIKRFQDFLPYLRRPSGEWATDWNRGITRILVGLVKKFAVADLLTAHTEHLTRADIAAAERWVLPVWLFAYGWKIYFDFSAYSDIAIGSGRLFGIRIPENFDWPYFRPNIAEFWRHWHMSLYKWLVDYVFVTLGGSRGSTAFVCRNVLIVLLVSGIWHGAGLNFVVWGLWHGVLLVVHRLWSGGELAADRRRSKVRWFAGWLLTYAGVNVGWAFFAMDLDTALYFLGRLFLG